MAKKQRWSDLPPSRRVAVVIAGTIQVSLQIAALVDIRRRPAEQIKGRKATWVALSFVNTLGPLAYFKFGRRR
ncbi:MAG TPA: PLD nuclease N-terminal domain-containing protein [Solirubrobacter sp.]|nr:PLD nuclease N-terminal domain-containing protein [Solirubrobacter sp.]